MDSWGLPGSKARNRHGRTALGLINKWAGEYADPWLANQLKKKKMCTHTLTHNNKRIRLDYRNCLEDVDKETNVIR